MFKDNIIDIIIKSWSKSNILVKDYIADNINKKYFLIVLYSF